MYHSVFDKKAYEFYVYEGGCPGRTFSMLKAWSVFEGLRKMTREK